MRVNIHDMADRERMVITKARLFEVVRQCTFSVEGDMSGILIPEVDVPDVIEVEEVIG